jgi:Uma2 family endonuclease
MPTRVLNPGADYLDRERVAAERSEFFDGRIRPMAGGGREHNLLCVTFSALIWHALSHDDAWEVYGSDCKVALPGENYAYPGVTVVRAPARFADAHRLVVANPVVIVEVLSPSTEAFDRGRKSEAYLGAPSVEEYLLIATDAVRVERPYRTPEGWAVEMVEGLGANLDIAAIGVEVRLADLYRQVLPPDAR